MDQEVTLFFPKNSQLKTFRQFKCYNTGQKECFSNDVSPLNDCPQKIFKLPKILFVLGVVIGDFCLELV
jgi:hypothetical protein